MKVILTGITGNLGYEIAEELLTQGHDVIAIIRHGTEIKIPKLKERLKDVLYADLLDETSIGYENDADYIVHCAGVVHFRNAGNSNLKMMEKVIKLAKDKQIPIYFVSTAFVYRPDGDTHSFNNAYENDKWESEQLLVTSGIEYQIIRPGIVVGHSMTGEIRNISGYYLVVKAFLHSIEQAKKKGELVRFPRLQGTINMVTVDQVAKCVLATLGKNTTAKYMFAVNPEPPTFEWVLRETLNHFMLCDNLTFVDVSFEGFASIDLTSIEKELYRLMIHFSPYWSTAFSFPESLCEDNKITSEYLTRTLSYFSRQMHNLHE